MTTADASDAAERVSSALSVTRYEASDATELTLMPLTAPQTAPNAATRPAVMRCQDPFVTVSHARRSGRLASRLKIISVKQLCSCTHVRPNARPQVPSATLRRSKCPRNSSHSASVGVRYSTLGRAALRRAIKYPLWVEHGKGTCTLFGRNKSLVTKYSPGRRYRKCNRVLPEPLGLLEQMC